MQDTVPIMDGYRDVSWPFSVHMRAHGCQEMWALTFECTVLADVHTSLALALQTAKVTNASQALYNFVTKRLVWTIAVPLGCRDC